MRKGALEIKKEIIILIFSMVLTSPILCSLLTFTVIGSTTHHVYPGQSIQTTINSAQSGDTIFVHSGTYFEHITLNKAISLIGENKYNTIIDGNGTGPVIHVTANNTQIMGFTVQNATNWSEFGIRVLNSRGNNISNNIITNNYWGIVVQWSSNDNILMGNIISSNLHSGFEIDHCDNNTFTCNTISSNGLYGIFFGNLSSNHKLIGNNISDNPIGVYIGGFSYNGGEIFHNNFINNSNQVFRGWPDIYTDTWDDGYPSGGNYWSDYNGTDLYSGPYQNETGSDGVGDTPYIIDANNQDSYPLTNPYGSVRNLNTNLTYLTIQSAIDANETLNGHTIFVSPGIYYEHIAISKSLSLLGAGKINTVIDGNSTGNVVTITTSNVCISGFTVKGSGNLSNWGIYVISSSNNLSYNTVTDNYVGIRLSSSSNNNIIGNNITANVYHGILATQSSNNSMASNHVDAHSNHGIWLDVSSNNNTISQSNITGNTRTDIYVSGSSNNNKIRGNNITNSYAGIKLVGLSTNNNSMYKNSITNNELGIFFIGTSQNFIYRNQISNNGADGILLHSSSNTTVYENNIANNGYGVWLEHSLNNTIYHNNFTDNAHHFYSLDSLNSWDDGFPSGGNYWSDHNPPDIYTGPCQNETGRDKIGDIPYIIDGNNTDRYPLIYPHGYVPSPDANQDGIVDIVDIVICALAFGSEPGDPNWNPYADLNQDGLIDIVDLVMIAIHFGETW